MKKTYITPAAETMGMELESMLAASATFRSEKDSQGITFTNEEYNGEFSVKENVSNLFE